MLAMLDRSTLNKLIDHAPLAITVMGVVVFLAAAAGGLPVSEPPLAVASSGWRIVLALLGAGLVSAGILLLLAGSGTGRAGRDVTTNAGRYGIRIDRPRPMEQIATANVVVIGSYAVRPPPPARCACLR
jgi:protein-S-isoprenylcysteine O-methyltransferase Ste14